LPEARARTPKRVPDRGDLREVRLSPVEGFVLSRVDGAASESDILVQTGLPQAQVQAAIAKLESLGIITFAAPPPPARPAGAAPAAAKAAPNGPAASPTPPRGTPPARPERPLTPEEEAAMAEPVDLEEDFRRRVITTHRELDQLDHYALLGVAPTAEKKEIKRAYYELAARFHPDKYFRKKLGSFKLRMEAIFGRVTAAHDVLSNKTRRQEYDAYLAELKRARGIESLLAEAMNEMRLAEDRADREARADEGAPPPLPPAAPETPQPAPAAARPEVRSAAERDADLRARREALARRLGGARPQGPRVDSATAQPAPQASEAVEALRRRYEDRKEASRAAQSRKYVRAAETALESGDIVAAANAFRVALTLTPDDPDLQRRGQDADFRANAVLAETYAKQAAYEEKNARWPEAARSWLRVCKTRPDDGLAHERAAHALMKSGDGDLREAVRLAQRAAALLPEDAQVRLTLGVAYQAAGLMLNAQRELEKAAQLSPHDGTIQAALKRIGKSA